MRTLTTLVVGVLASVAAAWSLISGLVEPPDVLIMNDVAIDGGSAWRMLLGFALAVPLSAIAAFCFVLLWKRRRDNQPDARVMPHQ
jgi:hypothetical protein